MKDFNFSKEFTATEFAHLLDNFIVRRRYFSDVDNKQKISTKSVNNDNLHGDALPLPNEIKELLGDNGDGVREEIISNLISQALANGLDPKHLINRKTTSVSEGSTAMDVSLNNADVFFATKIDNDQKLVREAITLKMVEIRPNLPRNFGNYFPKVYATKSDGPPYAYIMEAFRMDSMAKYLYKTKISEDCAINILDIVSEILIGAYKSSRNQNLRPNISVTYLDRITERLKLAAELDKDFERLIKSEVVINGERFQPAAYYVEQIQRRMAEFEVPFTTFVHGDAHPENILISSATGDPTIKFIDPKDWYEGDYVFDLGKLCHYLLVTGPVEKAENKPDIKTDFLNPSITYDLIEHCDPGKLVDYALKKFKALALEFNDTTFEKRYNLSMASNLLGLPVGRLQKGDKKSSAIEYAEGLKFLASCIK
ncbi:phosphotransferase [Pedobacter sp. PF22-3]|uniref:phosphotransferase family protein n=1 Tax=Pedobacter sp. PF22-3 TaxID=2994467 RepID=UPI0022465BC3|nr:phosphotransferase [Pedobacter sp. PF22-3]MCX2492849.1 phosphotransferase [Pedobacter sp. PF22-3]